jgi:tetratricopeptide (TPR) repeat protein
MVTVPLLVWLVLLAAPPALRTHPHADAREIKSLLRDLPEPTDYFYPDLSSLPPESKGVLSGSAEAAIARVSKDAGLERQDAIDFLAAMILPTFDIDDAHKLQTNKRRRALFESVLAHAPGSETVADAFGRAVVDRNCALPKRAGRLAILERLPPGLSEYWIGMDYLYDGHDAEGEPHLALAATGPRRADRARFEHSRLACRLGNYEVCLKQVEATKHDEPDDRLSGVIGAKLEARRVWWRGIALAGLGRAEEARAAFSEALGRADARLDPVAVVFKDAPVGAHEDLAVVLCETGKTYAQEKKWREAETLLSRGSCLKELGNAYFDQGKLFDAVVTWQSAHDNDDAREPDRIRAFARLGAFGNAMERLSILSRVCDEKQKVTSDENESDSYHPRPVYCDVLVVLRDEVVNLKVKAEGAAGGGEPAHASKDPVLERLLVPKLASWHEVPIPPGAKPITLLKPSKALASRSVVFEAAAGERAVAVSVSGDIDPRGEVSRGGYWAHLSDDGGKTFRAPLYLGFAEGYPYIVEGRPRIAPFDGRTLRIEVRRREIDDTKITFPPSPQIRSSRNDIYIEVPLEDLVRDSDGDGLTDLFEEKIATDSTVTDTDADGLGDAKDPQPLAPKQTILTPADEILASALSDVLFAHGPALYVDVDAGDSLTAHMGRRDTAAEGLAGLSHEQTLFILSDRPILRALATSIRVIVLGADQTAAYRAKFGFTTPLEISVIFDPAGNRALLIYDFQWRGGAYLAIREEGRWKMQVVEGWIT